MFNSNQAINQEDREIADFFTEKCLLNRTHRNVINTKSNIMSNPVEILWKSCGNLYPTQFQQYVSETDEILQLFYRIKSQRC